VENQVASAHFFATGEFVKVENETECTVCSHDRSTEQLTTKYSGFLTSFSRICRLGRGFEIGLADRRSNLNVRFGQELGKNATRFVPVRFVLQAVNSPHLLLPTGSNFMVYPVSAMPPQGTTIASVLGVI